MNARRRMWPAVIAATTGLTLTAAVGGTVAARSTDDRPLQVGGITEAPEVAELLTQGWTSDPFGGGAIPNDYLTTGGGSTMADPVGGGVALAKGYGTSTGPTQPPSSWMGMRAMFSPLPSPRMDG